MSLAQEVGQLFAEVGPAGNLFAVDEYASERLWHVAVDETSILFAELDEGRGVVVLSADLGRPAATAAAGLYPLLLTYNHAWPQSGGARISLEGEGGALWLLLDISPAGLDAGSLGNRIKAFARLAAAWREIVAGRVAAAADEIGSLNFGAIRI